MTTWQWQTWQGKPYLTCSLLDPFSHGFFTRQFRPDTPRELVRVLDAEATAYRTQQVHGRAIARTCHLEPLASETVADLQPADGILTHPDGNTKESVWVCSADCTPVLIADVRRGCVSAIHAGWRGTAAKIVPEAIAAFREGGSRHEDLRVALGPAISGDLYQVSSDVAVRVGRSIVAVRDDTSDDEILQQVSTLPDSPVLPDSEPGKVRLDVRQAIRLQLDRLNISPEQIAVSSDCTYQQSDRFFSYRRTGEKKVQWSGIVSQGS
ncbi:peptidoglycan editing factor PgeF [Geitlerinema sp. CS-897]|nr:peptidoglycan editing factor PgeF [Geitlerinema sp. CS-897]